MNRTSGPAVLGWVWRKLPPLFCCVLVNKAWMRRTSSCPALDDLNFQYVPFLNVFFWKHKTTKAFLLFCVVVLRHGKVVGGTEEELEGGEGGRRRFDQPTLCALNEELISILLCIYLFVTLGGWTQGLVFARKALYQLSPRPQLLYLKCFLNISV